MWGAGVFREWWKLLRGLRDRRLPFCFSFFPSFGEILGPVVLLHSFLARVTVIRDILTPPILVVFFDGHLGPGDTDCNSCTNTPPSYTCPRYFIIYIHVEFSFH